MRGRDFFWFLVCGLLVGVIVLLLFRGGSGSVVEGDGFVEGSGLSGSGGGGGLGLPEALPIASLDDVLEGQAEEARLRELSPDDYYDPDRLGDRDDVAYQRRLLMDQRIGTYLYSSRKDDPAFRRVMVLLLENGYGIEEWMIVVNRLGASQGIERSFKGQNEMLDRALERGLMEEEDVESEKEINALMMRHERRGGGYSMFVKAMADTTRITDSDLLEALWAVDVGVVNWGDGSLGEGRERVRRGDRLLTDADWMTDEFLEARGRFVGVPPSRFSYDLSVGEIMALYE